MTKITMDIRGMSCGHCVKGVQKALGSLDGVQVEQVQIGSATVQYDPAKVTPDAMKEAVADEGYEVVAVIPSASEGSARADSSLHSE